MVTDPSDPTRKVEVENPRTFTGARNFFIALGKAGKANGLYWGGDFSRTTGSPFGRVGIGWDPGHLQLRPGSELQTVRKATEAVRASLMRQDQVARR